MKTAKEGVTTILDKEGNLTAMIYKDMKSRQNVFFRCEPMSMEELEQMVQSDVIKATTV